MTNSIEFPNSIYEFLSDNSFKDTDEVYTNGSMLIPTFRVKQAIEHYYKPCEDAISRKRLIILIDEGAELHPYKVVGDSETYSDYNQGWTDAFDWLYANIDCDNLPSVKPQQRWIPVSERLPEDDKKVLVYVKRKDSEKSEMNGFHIARKHYMEGDPEGKSNFWGMPIAPCEWIIEGWSYFFEPEVLAWMPLPQSYKEGEQ